MKATQGVKGERSVKQRVGTVGEVILGCVAVAGVLSIALVTPNALQALGPFFKKKKYSPRQAVHRNIESLIRAKLLKRSVNARGEVTLELTRRGRWEVLIRGKVRSDVKEGKWDGVWRVIVFDVPVAKKDIRDELRRGLRLYGFYQLQRSVWVYPYRCDAFIALLKEHLGVAHDVLVMEVGTIEHDAELKRTFKLH